MSGTEADAAEAPKRRSKLPLVIGAVLLPVMAGAGFAVTYLGLVGGAHVPAAALTAPLDVAFVPIGKIVVSVGAAGEGRHLHFNGEIEVAASHQPEVALLMPRVLDVLNGYLGAVEQADFEDAGALVRLRAQMLRRVKMVAGEDRVRDLLITEFVIN